MLGHDAKKASGFVITSGPEGVVEGETRRCSHCGVHWLYEPGSGRKRGYCLKCGGLTCGKADCDICLPYEARIELAEGAPPGSPARKYLAEYLEVARREMERGGVL